MNVPPFLKKWLPPRKGELSVTIETVQPESSGEADYAANDTANVEGAQQVPTFERLLTAPTGPMPLGEGPRAILAALQLSKTSALVLVVDKAEHRNEHLTLQAQLRERYKQVDSIKVSHSQLRSLYAREMKGGARVQQRLEGEHAASGTTFMYMIELGVREKASDLHVEISEENDTAELRYRVDGELETLDVIRPASIAQDAMMYAYTKMAEETSRSEPAFNKRIQQSCNIPVSVDNEQYTLRWSSTPKVGGFKVVFRLLRTRASGKVPTLDSLGFAPSQVGLLSLLLRSKGAIVIAGDTGSGKSTTLRTLADMIPDKARKSIVFIEDPVEYRKEGVTEISVQRSAKDDGSEPVAAAMRTAMRQDPDVVVPGEIRDHTTAQLFEFLVDSGHKGMTTTHASSAAMAIRKLSSETVAMSREVLGSRNFLAGVMYQQLVQILCECKKAAAGRLDPATAHLLVHKFGLSLDTMFVTNEAGCEHCRKGVVGRKVLAEIIPMNRELQLLIRNGRDGDVEDAYRSTRCTDFTDADMTGKTVFEHGLYLAHCGLVDPMRLATAIGETYELYEVLPISKSHLKDGARLEVVE